ncbi:cytochrome c oxidase assembly factor 6 homolog [Trachemys scripta elegans]|uniref:cytochrome c oxidase assembly factor 6 homolog n=1 Tax=Trachemys scripta elegans TaxID=31138 RepID=UPI001551CD53|nr:cytochrome c oxidase assembly factor 6 homolog [Trachemys scripta elegans]
MAAPPQHCACAQNPGPMCCLCYRHVRLFWICIRSGVTASAVRLPEVIKMSAPSMEERKACWGARDEYWKCLDENMEDASSCQKLRCSFESRCPQQWVKYFDKRRDFLKYKEQLQAGEYQPPGTTEKS